MLSQFTSLSLLNSPLRQVLLLAPFCCQGSWALMSQQWRWCTRPGLPDFRVRAFTYNHEQPPSITQWLPFIETLCLMLTDVIANPDAKCTRYRVSTLGRWGNRGSSRLRDLPKVTGMESGYNQISLTPKHALSSASQTQCLGPARKPCLWSGRRVFLFVFLFDYMACKILIPWPGIKPMPPAVEAESYPLGCQGSPGTGFVPGLFV